MLDPQRETDGKTLELRVSRGVTSGALEKSTVSQMWSGSQERLYSAGDLGMVTLQLVCKPVRVRVLSRYSKVCLFLSPALRRESQADLSVNSRSA